MNGEILSLQEDQLISVPDWGAHVGVKRLAAEKRQLVATSSAANSLAAREVAEGFVMGKLMRPTIRW